MAGSSKNALTPVVVIAAGDMSGNVTQAKPTNIQYLDNVAIQLSFTGTPTGTFAIQGSLDFLPTTPNGPPAAAGNWVSLTLSPAPVAAGAANSILLDMNQLSFPWIRVTYTAGSSTGVLTASISGKAV